MTTTSKTLTVDTALVDGTGSLDVNWDSVIEKMNSTPGTPKEEKEITAESTTEHPIQTKEKVENAQESAKSTIRLIPKSPVQKEEVVEDSTTMSPLDISKGGDQKNLETTPTQTVESQSEIPKGENKDTEVSTNQTMDSKSQISEEKNNDAEVLPTEPSLNSAKEEVKEADTLPIQTVESPVGSTEQEKRDTQVLSTETTNSKSDIPEEENKVTEVTETTEDTTSNSLQNSSKAEQKEIEPTSDPVSNGVEEVKKDDVAVAVSSETTSSPDIAKEVKDADVKKDLEVPAGSDTISSPNNDVKEGEQSSEKKDMDEKKDLTVPPSSEPTTSPNNDSKDGEKAGEKKVVELLEKIDTTQTPTAPEEKKDAEQKKDGAEPADAETKSTISSSPKEEKVTEEKKGLQLLTKLKRKLSTKNMKEERQDPPEPLPKPKPVVSSASPVEGPEHIELVKSKTKSPPTSPREGKKMDILFKSIRAAMKFSSGKSPKSSPTASRFGQTPLNSPISPMSKTFSKTSSKAASPVAKTPTKTTEKTTERPSTARPPTAKVAAKSTEKSAPKPAEKKITEKSAPKPQPSVRRPGHNSPAIKATLKPAQTWSPSSSNPILASNPSAKLYTIWPRYPVVEAQTDEVQAVLEGFLLGDKGAIEKSGERVGGAVSFWKAPLTAEQAAVVQENKFVSNSLPS